MRIVSSSLNYIGLIFTSLHLSVKVTANFDLFGFIWTCLDLLGLAWTCLDLFGLVWTCLDLFGLVWTCLDLFGLVWTCLVLEVVIAALHITKTLKTIINKQQH